MLAEASPRFCPSSPFVSGAGVGADQIGRKQDADGGADGPFEGRRHFVAVHRLIERLPRKGEAFPGREAAGSPAPWGSRGTKAVWNTWQAKRHGPVDFKDLLDERAPQDIIAETTI